MVSSTNFPPNADNPDRAPIQGSGNDYVVSLTGDVTRFLRADGTWALPPGGGGGSVWGGITGTLSNQTDLQSALDAKANSSAISVVGFTGVYNDLSGKPTLGTVAALSYPGGTSAFLRADGTWQIPVDVQAVWGSITGTLSNQTDLNNALNAKAALASPTFTGTPLAPTAALNTNTTQIATTAYVQNQGGDSVPLMNGTSSSGSSPRWSRMDHVHPSDTSRAPLVSPVFTGVPQAPTAAPGTNTTQLATTAFVTAALAGVLTNPMTTAEDIIIGGVSGAPARLAKGANGTFLGVVGGVLTYTTPAGSGDVVGPASAVNGRVATFNGTTGKLIQDGGVLISALAPLSSPAFTSVPTAPTASVGTDTTQLATTAFVQAARRMVVTLFNGVNYTAVLTDANNVLGKSSADTATRTYTIPAEASVNYPVGTTLTFMNNATTGSMNIAITTDTMYLAGTATTGTRTLAPKGIATALKVESSGWVINGTGLT